MQGLAGKADRGLHGASGCNLSRCAFQKGLDGLPGRGPGRTKENYSISGHLGEEITVLAAARGWEG